MTVDAVIIGSGPGGSTAADVLTRAGWSVVIIEKGRNHLLDPTDLTKPSSDYSNDEIKFTDRYFLGPDPFLEPRTFRLGPDACGRGELHSVNRWRRRHPCRWEDPTLSGSGLRHVVHLRAPTRGGSS